MRLIKNILLFQRKIFFISYLLSIIIGLLFGGDFNSIGIAFLVISPLMQYFVYEIKNKNEYYFYYNLGLSNVQLWVSTLLIGILNLILLSII